MELDKSVFIELGTGYLPELSYLISPKQEKPRHGSDSWYRNSDDSSEWFGIFVEASPWNVVRLLEVLDERKCSMDSYKVLLAGVLDGTLQGFYTKRDVCESGTFHKGKRQKDLSLITVRLDSIIEGFSLKQIDLLRLDIEGSELVTLSNYSWNIIPNRIVVETHERKVKGVHEGVMNLLRKIGYSVSVCVCERHPNVPYIVGKM